MSSLIKVPFEYLKVGMTVAKADLKLYLVLGVDKEQVLMMKDAKSACVITADQYKKDDWFSVVKGNTRRKHGKG